MRTQLGLRRLGVQPDGPGVLGGGAAVETFDYYISPTGNDTTGDGSIGNPYATLTKVMAVTSASKKIGIRGGLIRDTGVTTSQDGLTIKAYPGETPIFCSSTAITSWTKTDGQTNVYQSTVTEVSPGAFNGTQILVPVASIALVDSTENSFIYTGGVLYVHILGGGAPTSIELITAGFILNINKNNVTVDGLTCQWSFNSFFVTGNNATIKNVIQRYQGLEKLTGHLWIRVTGADCVVDTCSLTGLNYDVYGIGFATMLMQVYATATRFTLKNSTLTNGAQGVTLETGTGHLVDTCSFAGQSTSIVMQAGAAGTLKYNTISLPNRASVGGIGLQGTGIVYIHHNKLFGLATGQMAVEGITATGAGTFYFYHNTIYHLEGTPLGSSVGIRLVPTAAGQSATLRNNIVQHCAQGIWFQDLSHGITLDLDYNSTYDCTTAFSNIAAGDQGTHNQTGNPAMVNPPTDFHLGAGSPDIGTGLNIAGISITNPVDIGAYG